MRHEYKVWLEIDTSAVRGNIKAFRRLVGKQTQLWAVVKSNAYGHGLTLFSGLADEYGVDGFCVDSVVEGLKLRKNGIKKPVLVLGYTLPVLYEKAAQNDITVTISNTDALRALRRSKEKPQFHLKIDTGMHRQGFYLDQLPEVIQEVISLKFQIKSLLTGIYTHFAAAKDKLNQSFTNKQFAAFEKARAIIRSAGFPDIVCHAAATGGALLHARFHADAVRIGIGLYGIWPSEQLERQLGKKILLRPTLAWHSLVSEIKTIAKGDGIGYDMTERAKQTMRLAIVPIGYWHGLPRAASSRGFVLFGKRQARIVGRVSMDMIMVDVTAIPSVRVGSIVSLSPLALARTLDASPYEIITRINPLIHKKIV